MIAEPTWEFFFGAADMGCWEASLGRKKKCHVMCIPRIASFTHFHNPDIQVIPFWETSKSLLSTGNWSKNGVTLSRVCHMPTNRWKWWKKQEHHFKPLKLMFTTAPKKWRENFESLIAYCSSLMILVELMFFQQWLLPKMEAHASS